MLAEFQRELTILDESKLDGNEGRADGPPIHLEEVRNVGKYITYCKKEGEYLEDGIAPHQGKRTDIIRMMESVEGGASDIELYDEHMSAMTRYHRAARDYRFVLLQSRSRERGWNPTTVHVLHGATGLGKTRWAYSNYPDLYRLLNDSNGALWFNGYCGEKELLLDDYRGWISYDLLLSLLDGYPCRLPIKGCFTERSYDTVIITSNLEPTEWYPAEGGLTPELARRLTTVRHITEALSFD